jgi:hypothetical protein|tara:strand:- start:5608 stop:6450 length:843 start_codon:yes stop_codon:yes gene_type:complete
MNILTDILSLFKRNKFVKEALPNDVLVLGLNQEPDMTGVASPIPYKSVRLIKVKDLNIAADHCDHANTPETPASNSGTVYQKTYIDPDTEKCTVYYRTLRSLSTNLTLANSADNDYVEISTTGEPNTAANVGTGIGVWKNKVGETLNFKTLIAGSNIAITETADEITIASTAVSYTSYVQVLSQSSQDPPTGPVLENSAGITITWTYQSFGRYNGVITPALSDPAKVALSISNNCKSGPSLIMAKFTGPIQLVSYGLGSGTPVSGDAIMLNATLEIKIYP